MKKLLAAALIAGLCVIPATVAMAEDADPIKVCIVYTGNLGDKSYNDSCNMGAQKAVEDFGIELKSLEGGTADEWRANLLQACEEGYDLIIGASSNIADYITEYNEYCWHSPYRSVGAQRGCHVC